MIIEPIVWRAWDEMETGADQNDQVNDEQPER